MQIFKCSMNLTSKMTNCKAVLAGTILATFHITTTEMAIGLELCNLLKLEAIRSAVEKDHINLFRL